MDNLDFSKKTFMRKSDNLKSWETVNSLIKTVAIPFYDEIIQLQNELELDYINKDITY